MWAMRPEGYHIEHKLEKRVLGKEEQAELVEAVVRSAWRVPSRDTYEDVYDGGISIPRLDRKRKDPLLNDKYHSVRDSINSHDKKIFDDYQQRRERTYPVWVKDGSRMERELRFLNGDSEFICSRKFTSPPSDTDDSDGIQTPVPPIDLGPATVWEVSEFVRELDVVSFDSEPLVIDELVTEQRLSLVSPRNQLKVFKNGIGIGPPRCF
jgi:hypothetical protein